MRLSSGQMNSERSEGGRMGAEDAACKRTRGKRSSPLWRTNE